MLSNVVDIISKFLFLTIFFSFFLVLNCHKLNFYNVTQWVEEEKQDQTKSKIKVHLTPKYFFRSNKSLHLFKTHCAFLSHFNPNLDLLQAVKVTKSGDYLLHDRAS